MVSLIASIQPHEQLRKHLKRAWDGTACGRCVSSIRARSPWLGCFDLGPLCGTVSVPVCGCTRPCALRIDAINNICHAGRTDTLTSESSEFRNPFNYNAPRSINTARDIVTDSIQASSAHRSRPEWNDSLAALFLKSTGSGFEHCLRILYERVGQKEACGSVLRVLRALECVMSH